MSELSPANKLKPNVPLIPFDHGMGKATRRIYEELGHFKLEEAVVETGRHFS
jgi:hypothetical protein